MIRSHHIATVSSPPSISATCGPLSPRGGVSHSCSAGAAAELEPVPPAQVASAGGDGPGTAPPLGHVTPPAAARPHARSRPAARSPARQAATGSAPRIGFRRARARACRRVARAARLQRCPLCGQLGGAPPLPAPSSAARPSRRGASRRRSAAPPTFSPSSARSRAESNSCDCGATGLTVSARRSIGSADAAARCRPSRRTRRRAGTRKTRVGSGASTFSGRAAAPHDGDQAFQERLREGARPMHPAWRRAARGRRPSIAGGSAREHEARRQRMHGQLLVEHRAVRRSSGEQGARRRAAPRGSRRQASGAARAPTESAVRRDDLIDVLAEDRPGRHHEAVGDIRRGGGAAVDRAVDQHLLGAVGRASRRRRGARRLRPKARPPRSSRAPFSRAIRTSPSGVRIAGALEQLVGHAARAQQPVGGRHERARVEPHGRLLDPEVDHVVLLAVPPDRRDADRASGRGELAQQRREGDRLAGVLGEPDEREAASAARSARRASRAAHRPAGTRSPDSRAASSRTMNVARWCG